MYDSFGRVVAGVPARERAKHLDLDGDVVRLTPKQRMAIYCDDPDGAG